MNLDNFKYSYTTQFIHKCFINNSIDKNILINLFNQLTLDNAEYIYNNLINIYNLEEAKRVGIRYRNFSRL